ELLRGLLQPRSVIQREQNASDSEHLSADAHVIAGTLQPDIRVAGRHCPTNQNAPEGCHVQEEGVQHVAADIVEVGIHALWAQRAEALIEVFVLVVDGCVVSGFLDDPAALVWATGSADDRFCTEGLTDPSGEGTGSSGSGRHDHRVALFYLKPVDDTEV